MSRPLAPIVCDGPGCGKHKQEANHWWTIHALKNGRVTIARGTITDDTLVLADGGLFDACGQDCALKIVSEQMGKVTS